MIAPHQARDFYPAQGLLQPDRQTHSSDDEERIFTGSGTHSAYYDSPFPKRPFLVVNFNQAVKTVGQR
ncbi:MAG: hypothetical protein DRQ24_07160 [Candidatus Latescibacterota bacterium]|nr:MAG: hypothetical protein DRQ24_07160 [Candidatus Latescibacterota bacterium]